MNIPPTIFIDTSIFDESAYNLNSAKFKAFRSLAENINLKLLIPDPIDREIRRHIRERSQTAVKSLEDAAKRAPFLRQLSNWPLNEKNSLILTAELKKNIEDDLSDLYSNFEVVKLGYKGIEINEVMNWYDWRQAPFSDKKKNEFPDAFAIASLKQYHKSSGDNIAIISKDRDFEATCKNNKYFLYFPSLPAYTEAIQGEDERINQVHQILTNNDAVVRKAIAEEFTDLSFLIEANWDGEASEIEVSNFNEIEYFVVGIGHQNYIISFDAEISFSAYVSYWDLETAVHDGGEAYPLHKIEEYTETVTSISGTFKLTTDESKKHIISCNSVHFEQDYISISDGDDY